MYRILALSVFVVSCVCPGTLTETMTNEDFVTPHGLNIHPQGNWVSQQAIERITEITTVNINAYSPYIYPGEAIRAVYKNNIHIYVEENYFDCQATQEGVRVSAVCDGLYYEGNKIRYVNRGCLGNSAFAHEILHLLNYKLGGFADSEHERVLFFGDPDRSLEHIINDRYREKYCRGCW